MSRPRNLVTVDDPITYVVGPAVILERVETVQREEFLVATGRPFLHSDEGATWARGYHLPDSETVRALHAAKAMEEPTRQPQAPFPLGATTTSFYSMSTGNSQPAWSMGPPQVSSPVGSIPFPAIRSKT